MRTITPMKKILTTTLLAISLSATAPAADPRQARPATAGVAGSVPRSPDITFRSRMIDPGPSEAVAVADVNRDGRPDIVSGEFWYEAPAWRPHRFRTIEFRSQYLDSFSDLPVDADGDGYPDIVSVSWFAKKVSWWKNPGRSE